MTEDIKIFFSLVLFTGPAPHLQTEAKQKQIVSSQHIEKR